MHPTAHPTHPVAEVTQELAQLRLDIARLQAREAALRDRLPPAMADALPRTPRPGWPIRRLPPVAAGPRH